MRRASVVIDNYDYGRFLGNAIESALDQTWPATEVVVVDDGSEDESREVLARYADRVTPVLKANGGQASALNAGFARCHGDVVLFLDADDALLPDAVAAAVEAFDDPAVVKAHWPLWVVDETGNRTGRRHPDDPLPSGDRREALLRAGPTTEIAPPTSGNAWSRRFLEEVLPIPEELYRISADKYLLELAPFLGELRALEEPRSLYRVHGRNSQLVLDLETRLELELSFYEQYTAAVCEHLARRGVEADVDAWRRSSWWHRQAIALRELKTLPVGGGPLVLVDDGSWGEGSVGGRERLPFVERDGLYDGQPAGDDVAIAELERMRRGGASFLVFVWSTFWWLDHYAGFRDHLRNRFSCPLESENVVAFDLRQERCR